MTEKDKLIDENFKACFWGGVVADIYGSFFEFKPPKKIPKDISFESIRAMGKNVFGHEFGYFTDDTIMMLCAMESFVESGKFDKNSQMRSMGKYIDGGKWTRDGKCFDVGMSTLTSYMDWKGKVIKTQDREKFGNGVIMKYTPYAYWNLLTLENNTEDIIYMTHSKCCFHSVSLMEELLYYRIYGKTFNVSVDDVFGKEAVSKATPYGRSDNSLILALQNLDFDDYEKTVLNCIKLGYDTDTNACIAGQLVGYRGDLSFVKYYDEINILLEEFINATKRARDSGFGGKFRHGKNN